MKCKWPKRLFFFGGDFGFLDFKIFRFHLSGEFSRGDIFCLHQTISILSGSRSRPHAPNLQPPEGAMKKGIAILVLLVSVLLCVSIFADGCHRDWV
jgi:hypothetical protein